MTFSKTISDADQLHRIFNNLKVYDWQSINNIPFNDGIYIVFEKGEIYHGLNRIVRVGINESQDRFKQRLKDHFIRQNHNGSIFRKNVGRAILHRDKDQYLPIWNTSKAKEVDKNKEKEIEQKVTDYMRSSFTFCVFKVDDIKERPRMEKAIIATLNQADDFKPSPNWLGNNSPEVEICQSGMWLKEGLNDSPITELEMSRLQELLPFG